MKCPYNNFTECIVEKCPSCIYKTIEDTKIDGRYPTWMSPYDAVKLGYAWESVVKSYEFVSCKLIDNNVQLPNKVEQIVNNTNTNTTSVSVRRGLF